MKNLVYVLISFFIFVGCAPKPEVVIPTDPGVSTPTEPEIIVPEPEIEVPEPKEELVDDGLNKVAIIYPSRIVGKYAKSTINTITAYLIYKNRPFEIESFDTYDESEESINLNLEMIKERGFTKVIALFTKNGFDVVNNFENRNTFDLVNSFKSKLLAKVYFPLINKTEIETQNKDFIFGGISYLDQINILNDLSSGNNTMFYVSSYIGNSLKTLYENSFTNIGVIKEIQRKNNQYKYIMKDERIEGDTIILNTPIIKSSIIMSQLTTYDIKPEKILSTQLNYNPLLIKLTQERDRTRFYVVNSIGDVELFLKDYTKLIGSDISYNWVDYSSLVGVDYLLDKESKLINSTVFENQVEYLPQLYKATAYGFRIVPTN